MLSTSNKVTSFYLGRFPRSIANLLKPAMVAAARLFMMFTGNKIQSSKYSMVLDPRDSTGSFYFICNYMFGAPCLEHLEIKLFMGLIEANPNTKVVDVGANYGYYTLEACTLLQKPENIIAIEPDDQVFSCLSSSVKYSKRRLKIATLGRSKSASPFRPLW